MEGQPSVQEILAIFHKWGIRTLGQLAALDKEQLGLRLGSEAVRLWERANGKSERLLKLVRPPESFQESFEFEQEIETAEPLFFILRRFLEQLSLRLSTIYLAAKELTLRITFSNKQQVERVFKIPQPTNNVDLLFRILQTHFENFRSEHSIVAVALEAQPIQPGSQQFGLFETALRNPQQLYETLGRLSALLGADRVGTPVLEDTHRPDAFRMEPFSSVEVIDHNRAPSKNHLSRPVALRRFRPAPAASVSLSQTSPANMRGPYLLSGNWWDQNSWARVEWDIQLEEESVIRCHESEGTWKIDGIYD